ncbi:MAG: Biopolymer transport protein ExbB [candidate division BRC1 bacterium ADurb.BinA292]|nr:MAG: Biopolymer transport protein ExbB [candidate division BRC1 bacterium ADurb.BinA292]
MIDLIRNTGPIVLVYLGPLALYSILSVAVVLERALMLRKLNRLEESEYARIREGLMNGKRGETIGSLPASEAPIAAVVRTGIDHSRFGAEQVKEAIGSALALQTARFSRYLGVLATVGATAPFIGLFGTVLGILRAFHEIGVKGFGGPSVVANGIAEALIATAFGLGIAIPAVIAYNVFTGQVKNLNLTVGAHASELVPFMMERERADARA